MDINGIHHIAIICRDYQVSKKFYTEILGFKIISEIYRSQRKSHKLNLLIPGGQRIQIELFSFPDSPKRPSYPEALGLRHLAFAVSNLEKSISELKSKGVMCEEVRIDPETKKKFTFFNDPDMLPLELYEM